ncbi:Adenosylcobinamide kinase [Candidatus Hodgkinia cicadicola]|uniref:Adenosylcobinamide kinase n=1 Tax=Candidatus Hodgkinia cicadicola TaxID=573658 RepID=A0ABX4MHQ0_9HYPH|nr:Adenosylcobinamide kinase [Candidatus Hodgkinia cicadicola]
MIIKHNKVIIIGLPRTGKSRIIRSICRNLRTLYVVTNPIYIKNKMVHHIKYKPDNWSVYEESTNLTTIIKLINKGTIVIIDDIATWLANIMVLKSNCYNEIDQLLMILKKVGNWIIITNQQDKCVNSNQLNTRFIRLLENTNQQLTLIANQIYISVAGFGLRLK